MEIATKLIALGGVLFFLFLLLWVTSKLFIVSAKANRILEALKQFSEDHKSQTPPKAPL
jgi:hypothetical protein